uniref:Uncharacterized protein n=1 Tax=Strongyloides papillosus TaxID=174720 RepID=A0A0N5CIK5_STREA
LSSFINRNEISSNQQIDNNEEFKCIKDGESLELALRSTILPDFIQKISKSFLLSDIEKILDSLPVSNNTLPGEPSKTKFGFLLENLKINPAALWKHGPTEEDIIIIVHTNEGDMCLYAGYTCILNTRNLTEIIHLALCFKINTTYPTEPNLEFLLCFFAKKLNSDAVSSTWQSNERRIQMDKFPGASGRQSWRV